MLTGCRNPLNRSADDTAMHGGTKLKDRRANAAATNMRRNQQLAGVGNVEGRGKLHRDGSAKDAKRVKKMGELGRGLSSDDGGQAGYESPAEKNGGCCVVS